MVKHIENGRLYLTSTLTENNSNEWNAHPSFKGVYLKHFVTSAQTNGQFSAHMVKVEPNCTLDLHIHDGKTEMHEVIEGSGICIIYNKEYTYAVGDMSVIPSNTTHKVVAGNAGLYLLAKFVPALV